MINRKKLKDSAILLKLNVARTIQYVWTKKEDYTHGDQTDMVS